MEIKAESNKKVMKIIELRTAHRLNIFDFHADMKI